MATQLQIRRGTSAQVAAFTGAEGEIVVNTTNDSVHVNDGSTAGGFEMARVDGSNWAITNAISTTANISFGDNDKAIFGAGSDLQIYHDGSNSYIAEAGTGDLRIRGANVEIQTGGGNKYFQGSANVARLYHTNNEKLATSGAGIAVTGTVVSDGATIDGALELNSNNLKHTALTPNYTMFESDVTGENTQLIQASGLFRIRTVDDSSANPVRTFQLSHSTGDISFYDGSDNAGFFWDSSAARLGIGTTSPNRSLHIIGQYVVENSASSPTGALLFIPSSDANRIYSRTSNSGSSRDLAFVSGSTEAMRIDASGNVGIGTSSPASELDVAGTTPTLTIKDTQNKSWTSSDTTLGELAFRTSDTSGIGAHNVAFVRAVNEVSSSSTPSGALSFGVSASNANASEAMRIDASGNLLVGTTSSAPTTGSGFAAQSIGRIFSSVDDGYVLSLNRDTSDGEILRFRKDGTIVGSIGAASNDLNINGGANHSGIRFQATGLYPLENGSASSGEIDLGAAGSKFKNLYLSGGAYLGGTGSANKLDDYEEGTWTPTLSFGGVTTGITYSNREGAYTKVGRLVTAFLRVTLTSNGTATTGQCYISLPFTVSHVLGTTNVQGSSIVGFMSNFTGSHYGVEAMPFEGNDHLRLYQRTSVSGDADIFVTPSNISNNFDCRITVQFMTS